MKNLLIVLPLAALIYGFTFVNSNAPENNQVVGIATAALKQNCNNTQGQLDAEVINMSGCYVGNGVVKKVIFTRNGEVVGTVLVNCEMKAYRVACGNEKI